MSVETDNLSAAETFAKELQEAMKPVESTPAPVNPVATETVPVPEQVIKPPVEATKEASAPVVPTPSPVPPENIVPSWAKGLDMTNEDVVEAINHFAGNESADWTRTPTDKMDKEKFSKFRVVQGQYEKARLEAKKAKEASEKVDTVDYLRETLNKLESRPDVYEEVKRISRELDKGKPVEEPKGTVEEIDLKKKIAEKLQEGDWQGATDLIESTVSKRVSEGVVDAEKRTIERIRAEEQKRQVDDYESGLRQTAQKLKETDGVNYEQYTEADSQDGSSPLQRLLYFGCDPVTGKTFRSGNAEKDLRDAYAHLLSQRRGNGGTRLRVSLTAQPQPKQTVGKEPSITDADMDSSVKTKDVMRRLFASQTQ
jgi:hypothetical protein